MRRFSATARIAVSLACLALSVLLIARTLGLVPDNRTAVMTGRAKLCESIAIHASLLAPAGDLRPMKAALEAVKARNHDILSIGIRRPDDRLLVEVGDHAQHWTPTAGGCSTDSQMFVPVLDGSEEWGSVEVRFRPLSDPGLKGIVSHPLVLLAVFFVGSSLVAFYVYLRKVLQHLNPSKVVPPRVRRALDTLAEGLLVLDKNERIVHANQAFVEKSGHDPEDLIGRRVSQLPWALRESDRNGDVHPWRRALDDGQPHTGVLLDFVAESSDRKTFIVNSTPILDDSGARQGVLSSFEDVTPLEQKKKELSQMLEQLHASSEQISQQNRELERLATTDPLTSCFNRRAFLEHFERQWKIALRHNEPLGCLMLDVDHFKSVNDRYGHSVGDQVLQKLASVLRTVMREEDVVCRYGGEEFAILLPHIAIEGAAQAAERLRAAIENTKFPHVAVTVSIGVSAIGLQAHDPQALLDQADRSLYEAKQNGRNRVARWHRLSEFESAAGSCAAGVDAQAGSPDEAEQPTSIPFQAVTALISALAYRDAETAEHSRRVADLCVSVAEGIMSLSDCYVLETAALLHDIGKIGVPDAILLKPGPLTTEEWEVMRKQDRIGLEIIRASFKSKPLSAIAENYRRFFGGCAEPSATVRGNAIPLGARILSIADAYDSMVSDHVYRKGRSRHEAFAELRRCAGTQFDAELVERLIEIISDRRTDRIQDATVSKETALSIGLQIESLAAALDQLDTPGLKAIVGRLKSTAAKYGVDSIAENARNLEIALEEEVDLIGIVQAATELVDLCRSTQKSFFRRSDDEMATTEKESP